MIKTDSQLKQDIERELLWDPKVNSAQVGVSVDHGTVTLLGAVDTYPQKWAAEAATKRVAGVRTVAYDLQVKVLADHTRSDAELATAVNNALRWDVSTPSTVTARVENSTVTLEGEVGLDFERKAAVGAVKNLTGIVELFNYISLRANPAPPQVKEAIQSALHRQATADASSIEVSTSGGKVTLTGHASSWQSIEDAASAAWAAPGVTEVVDLVKMQMTPAS